MSNAQTQLQKPVITPEMTQAEINAAWDAYNEARGLKHEFVNVVKFKNGDIVRKKENAYVDSEGKAFNSFQFRVRQAKKDGEFKLASALVPADKPELNDFYANLSNKRGVFYNLLHMISKAQGDYISVYNMFEVKPKAQGAATPAEAAQPMDISEDDLPF